ncbi:MAG: putative Sigma-70 family, polymerase ECF-type sigma factor [Candidatus Taylorbacteria bacterium]|nr:putative Sigma-70 family, polymerase ECF-type sigma factor [Candidatus Taylorbacteria bacterium]
MELTDQEIIESYIEGNKESLNILVNKYLSHIYNFVKRLYNNESDATDITQEVFIKVWKNIRKYNPNQNFKTWLFTIARNTTVDWMRKKKVYTFSDLESPDDDESFGDKLIDSEPLPEAIFTQKELKTNLEKLLIVLHPDQKTVILLHISEDMTFDEISKVLKKPLNTIKSHYRRGIEKLRKNIVNAPNLID